jgi:hypothetical protein
VSEYEHGTRLYQISGDGKITEQGFALPIGGATSAPHWAQSGKVFYTVDYQRGMDIWRYSGDTYVPVGGDDPGAIKPKQTTPPASAGALGLELGSVKGSLKKGVSAKVECSRACDLKASLLLTKSEARRVGLGKGAVVVAKKTFSGITKTTVTLRFKKSAASKLERRKSVAFKLKLTATAADGRSATATKTLRLR